MKRIILSRKGFDAKAGGGASPIFSDGRFFSIPIPQDHPSPKKYKDLDFYGTSGTELLKEASFIAKKLGKRMGKVTTEAQEKSGAEGSAEASNADTGEDVVDADFEEVKEEK